MAKLVFDAAGEHFFETGVSKGVLYVKDATGAYGTGVVWNGLSSVSESPEGAEETAIYADNIKYLSLRSAEEYKGTIEAYSSPKEFDVCDGCAGVEGAAGLKISQQARRGFGFCYQTKKGNDENPDAGFVIHIVYGATASPSERQYQTVNDSPEAMTLSWEFSCLPVEVDIKDTNGKSLGFKPVYHLEIDSIEATKSETNHFETLLDYLYGKDPSTTGGTDGIEPQLLTPEQIVSVLKTGALPTE